ncbi:hypothetical protein ACKC9G_07935 [Pokkaliibacter sp. CJK22405]|uniref:hypothetical protein n=1 Tax=Pokkaliibacter sp. CJK22405 TaxID=3384615 RepID=UPI003984841D
MNTSLRNVLNQHFSTGLEQVTQRDTSADTAAKAVQSSAKAQQAIQTLLGDSTIEHRLQALLGQVSAQHEAHAHEAAPDHQAFFHETRELMGAFNTLLGSFQRPEEKHFTQPCQALLELLDEELQLADKPLAAAQTQASHGHDHAHAHSHDDDEHVHHHHADTRMKRLLKKCLGTTDIDEGPHAAVGAKTGMAAVLNPDDGHSGLSRLQQFQHHETSGSGLELFGDTLLAGLQVGAGGLGYAAGKGERKEGQAEKKHDTKARLRVIEHKAQLLKKLEALKTAPADETPAQHQERQQHLQLLSTELRVTDWELERLDQRLGNVKYKIGLGKGSETAGALMMVKGMIELVCKPLAYASEVAMPVASTLAGVAGIGLSPAAAASGLYMGVNTLKLTKAQLAELQDRLKTAGEAFELIKEELPTEIREDYDRFFKDGKWASQEQGLKAFKKLLNWFVGGMGGYTLGATGISATKIAALVAGTATVADISASTAILASVVAVAYGTYGYARYHANIHEHEEWAEREDPELRSDLFKALAANGGKDSIQLPTEMARLLDEREDHRTDFLVDMAKANGLRHKKITTHSTDTAQTREKRETQRKEDKGFMQRTRESLQRGGQQTAALSRGVGSYLKHSAPQTLSGESWKKAYRDTRYQPAEHNHDHSAHHHDASAPPQAEHHHGHAHEHHHGHSHAHEHTHDHSYRPLKDRFKSMTLPMKRGAQHLTSTLKAHEKPALAAAREDFSDKTPYLNKTQMARILTKPESAAPLKAWMAQDVNKALTHMDNLLAAETRLFDVSEGDDRLAQALYQPEDNPLPVEEPVSQKPEHKHRFGLSLHRHHHEHSHDAAAPATASGVPVESAQEAAQSSSENAAEQTSEEAVKTHWQSVGTGLATDLLRQRKLSALAEKLTSETTTPAAMQGLMEAYLDLFGPVADHHHDHDHGPATAEPASIEQRFAQHLMDDANKEFRKKRSRLNTLLLGTAPLRLDAACRQAKVLQDRQAAQDQQAATEHERELAIKLQGQHWQSGFSASGAPQIL